MNNCLATLEELGGWEDDLEVEELSSIQSATLIIIVVIVHGPTPVSPLTSPQV
jgi:hypothetical protein